MTGYLRGMMCVIIFSFVVVLPAVHFRATYAHSKRLRVVVPGRVYRSGQLTVAGFEEHLKDLGIRCVVNLQDEYPDPDLAQTFFNHSTEKESGVCRRLGVKYVFIAPDVLPHRQVPARRPEAIEKMLAVFDDPASYPVLLHCKAGLHRTGCMVALYRMEYEGWSPERAVAEMRDNGFAASDCTSANEYIYQYVTTYRRGIRPAARLGKDQFPQLAGSR
jgi:protein tyrosine phosphatase (PTP) superfamily phosphohydrolase (DUF442 family)